MISEKHKNDQKVLRWFLILWVVFVSIGVLRGEFLAHFSSLSFMPANLLDLLQMPVGGLTAHRPGGGPGQDLGPRIIQPMNLWLFLSLLALSIFSLWLGLSNGIARKWYWLYFVMQGMLVLSMGFFAHQSSLMVSLSLVLILSALAMYGRVTPAIWVAGGVLGGFGLIALGERIFLFPPNVPEASGLHPLFWFSLWDFSDSLAMIFFVIGYLLLYSQQRRVQSELEQTYQKLQFAHTQLADSARQIESLTLLSERRRLARELHDTLAQGVAGLIMQLEVAQAHLSNDRVPITQTILHQTVQTARDTLKEARQAINDLRTRTTRQTTVLMACYEEIERFRNATNTNCIVHIEDLAHITVEHEDHLLRFVREALTNIAKHAQAQKVLLTVLIEDDCVIFTVEDDGCGFTTAHFEHESGHYGLLGLRERARLVGGLLSIYSQEGQGTSLRFCLPCAAREGSREVVHA